MTLTGCLWSASRYRWRCRVSLSAVFPESLVRTAMAERNSRVSLGGSLRNYLTISGTASEPTPRPFEIWLRVPRDISTARTIAWSPPTRACDTLREAVAVGAAEPGAAIPERGPAGRIGCRNLPLARFLPLRLIVLQV